MGATDSNNAINFDSSTRQEVDEATPSAAIRAPDGIHRALFTNAIGASVLSSCSGGVVVSHVFPGSAAAHCGMQVGKRVWLLALGFCIAF